MNDAPDNLPDWKYCASVYLPKHHCLLYRDDSLGVQKQVMTPRNPGLFSFREKIYFFIDGVDHVYGSENALIAALHLHHTPDVAHRHDPGASSGELNISPAP